MLSNIYILSIHECKFWYSVSVDGLLSVESNLLIYVVQGHLLSRDVCLLWL